VAFFLQIIFPAALLAAMFFRYKHAWIIGAAYFTYAAINGALCYHEIQLRVAEAMNDYPLPEGLTEKDMYSLKFISSLVGIIIGVLIDLAVGVLFIVKRKYFTVLPAPPAEKPEENTGQV
jgi:hypothetical protein